MGTDVLRAAGIGLVLGSCLLAIGLVRAGLAAARGLEVAGLSAADLPLLVGYLGAFAAGGAVVGALGTFRHSRLGAAAVGVGGAVPVALGIGVLVWGSPLQWEASVWWTMLIWPFALGSLVGVQSFYRPKPPRSEELLPPTRLRTVAPRPPDAPEA